MNKAIYLDMTLCVGCGACVVACMDERDIYPEKGESALIRVHQIEEGEFPTARIQYVSVACLHCQDCPCVAACPNGAITKDAVSGVVMVDRDRCTGCRNCAMTCPYGIPRYDRDGKMQLCDLCSQRVKAGLEPACVRVCPLGALRFDFVNKV